MGIGIRRRAMFSIKTIFPFNLQIYTEISPVSSATSEVRFLCPSNFLLLRTIFAFYIFYVFSRLLLSSLLPPLFLFLSIYLSHTRSRHAIILSRMHITAVRGIDGRNNWTATRVGRNKQGGKQCR